MIIRDYEVSSVHATGNVAHRGKGRRGGKRGERER